MTAIQSPNRATCDCCGAESPLLDAEGVCGACLKRRLESDAVALEVAGSILRGAVMGARAQIPDGEILRIVTEEIAGDDVPISQAKLNKLRGVA